MTDPAATWFPARNLRPWVDNYLEHPPEQLDVIKASICRNGWGAPCLAQAGSSRLIAGHGRLAAYLQLLNAGDELEALGELDAAEQDRLLDGLVPVRFREVPDDRAAELALADNESVRMSVRDDSRLAAVVRSLAEDTEIADLALGMSEVDVSALLKRDRAASAKAARDTEAPPIPPMPEEPDSQLGEVYQLGPHRLICGDSHDDEVLELVTAEGRAAMVATDPPFAIYGSATGLSASIADDAMVRPFFAAMWRGLEAVLDVWGHAYVFCDWRSHPAVAEAMKGTHMAACNLLVWDKAHPGLGSKWQNQHELISFAELHPVQKVMKGTSTGSRLVMGRSNVLTVKKVSSAAKHHNAEKPVELIEQLLEASSDEGEHVADLYAGSGTTLIAAARTGRRAVVVDKEPGWCDVIRRRWHAWATEAGVDPGPDALEPA